MPRRADAAADCLDEMHRLVQAAGRAESEVTAEDRKYWPAFEEGILPGSRSVSMALPHNESTLEQNES